ncbi:MAG: Coenzyme F420 hydrogenase/dehydrogenase, beta subunit C-terminal domain [Lachnospiraceae bacterium]
MDKSIMNSMKPCSGCGACATICPTESISYQINEDGFYTPLVNSDKCTNCGLCKKVCYKFLKVEESGKLLKNGKLYSAQTNNDDTLKTCTSGGIAYELAKYGLENHYIISGVIYDYELNIAKTIIVDNTTLEQTKGSKYIQAITGDCFKKIIEIAKDNKASKFMIFATPCQILGIKKSFSENKLNNELITIDLFCHGIPSYLVWNNYLDWLKKRHGINNLNNIVFRSKVNGWHDFTMKVTSVDKIYEKSSEYDLFYKAFFDNVLLNPSCNSCVVRKERSCADIRLGDLWGKKYQDNKDGVSAVLSLSDIGESIIKKLEEQGVIKIFDEENIIDCINNQSTRDYNNINFSAINDLKHGSDIKKVMTKYRRKFPLKRKIKLKMKEITAYFPKKIRKKLRNWYRKKV